MKIWLFYFVNSNIRLEEAFPSRLGSYTHTPRPRQLLIYAQIER